MNSFEQFEPDTEAEEDNSGIWLSISDLMSGLLMFFALLFIVVQVQLQQEITKAQRLEKELETYKKAVDDLPLKIIGAIEGKFSQGVVEVDDQTGDVKIGDRILFDEGSAELKPAGKQFLKQFIPIYSDVIFSDTLFESQITRVVIEGHTSSKGSDKTNMELSLRRALSVSDYIFSQQLKFKTKQKFNQKILASGRGEIDADKSKDNSSDRKVVFRFQFRREDFGELLKRANNIQKSTKK
jgi:outer membrane protein OmpA-like peptidoglycan-associated protein